VRGHPCVSYLEDYKQVKDDLYLLLKRYEGMNLQEVINRKRGEEKKMDEEEMNKYCRFLLKVFEKVISAFKVLSEQKVQH